MKWLCNEQLAIDNLQLVDLITIIFFEVSLKPIGEKGFLPMHDLRYS